MAKNNKGRIDNVVDIQAVKAQVDFLLGKMSNINDQFVVAVKNIAAMNGALKNAKGSEAVTVSINNQSAAIENGKKKVSEYQKILNDLAKKEQELSALNNGAAENYKKLVLEQQKVIDTKKKLKEQAISETQANKQAVDSMKGMEAELKRLTDAYKNMSKAERDSASGMQMHKQIATTRGELNKMRESLGDSTGYVGKYQRIWDGVGGTLAMAGGAILAVTGAIKGVGAVIASSQYLTDEWKKTVEGAKQAWNEFMNSLANMNFDNFTERMRDAIKAGADYAEMVDLLEKRNAGLSSQHKKEAESIALLRLSYYDHTKSAKERAAIMQDVIDRTTKMGEETAALAKKDYDAYLTTIIANKGISQSDLEKYLLFKQNTENSVQLIQELKNAEETYRKEGRSSDAFPSVAESYDRMIQLRVQGVGRFAKIEDKLNQEQIDKARKLYDAVAETNAAVYENKEGYYRKMEMQERKAEGLIDKEAKAGERARDKSVKAVENQLTAYQLLQKSISDTEQKIKDLAAANEPVPNSLIHQLALDKQELSDVDNYLKSIESDLTKIKSIQTPAVKGVSGSILTPRSGATENYDSQNQLSIDQAKDVESAKQDLIQQGISGAFDLEQSYADAAFDSKIANLERLKDAELANKNLTEAGKHAIEEKYAKKIAALKRQQFIKQKFADANQNLINTALAITKALPNIPLAWIVGAMGALQTGFILAAKVPEYFRGRKGGPAELAIVGDKYGSEGIRYANGKTYITPDKPTLTFLPKGADVIPHHKLLNEVGLMGMHKLPSMPEGLTSNDMKELRNDVNGLHNGFRMLANVVQEKTEHHVNITERGIWHATKNGTSFQKWLNDNIRY